jgi:hypothetical protein
MATGRIEKSTEPPPHLLGVVSSAAGNGCVTYIFDPMEILWKDKKWARGEAGFCEKHSQSVTISLLNVTQ